LADAIKRGAIDGAALAPTALFDFRVAAVAKNHYLLRGGVAPLVVLMNRKKFDSLPQAAQDLIRKYSGEWTAAAWIKSFGASERFSLDKIKLDSTRKVVEPSPADRAAAQRAYKSLMESWAAKSPRNRELLNTIEADLATIRSSSGR
jgi:TRAP-type C4-dicarboxylate transport system substrate-binding protein